MILVCCIFCTLRCWSLVICSANMPACANYMITMKYLYDIEECFCVIFQHTYLPLHYHLLELKISKMNHTDIDVVINNCVCTYFRWRWQVLVAAVGAGRCGWWRRLVDKAVPAGGTWASWRARAYRWRRPVPGAADTLRTGAGHRVVVLEMITWQFKLNGN